MNKFQCLLKADSRFGKPTLRPGDKVKVDNHIGVITKAETVINGSAMRWDRFPVDNVRTGCFPSYAIAWRSFTGLKTAWWTIEEINEVVSLVPFHS